MLLFSRLSEAFLAEMTRVKNSGWDVLMRFLLPAFSTWHYCWCQARASRAREVAAQKQKRTAT